MISVGQNGFPGEKDGVRAPSVTAGFPGSRRLFAVVLAVLCVLCLSAPASWGGNGPAQAESGAAAPATQSVRVGDIDVSYRIMGEGYPIVLITGYGATMDLWDPMMLKELSSRYKVVLFDNRGIDHTTASDKPFTIELFAEDTRGLMDALKIGKAHVLGWSMGTFIATELALAYPERVNKLILYGGNCGWTGNEVVKASPEVSRTLMDLSIPREERSKRLIGILFPKKWLEDHPGFVRTLPRPKEPPSQATIERQGRAIASWQGTCARLDKIASPTLVITGTEDVVIPPANSLLMASRIPGSWLIRLPGGHANMYQFPGTFSRCLLTFLEGE
jgi:pimeloyl-ACP methyl ester carboxylesterase